MRLIDADSFIQEITDEITNLRLNGLKGTPRSTSELYEIIDRIKEQPTAYDVEAKVAEIKKSPTDDDWLFVSDGNEPMIWKSRAISIVREKERKYCGNCKHQPEPLTTCEFLKSQTQIIKECPRWEGKE